MGENSFGSSKQLLQEKRLPPREGQLTPAMARGNALEPIAREAYCQTIQQSVEPKCLESTEYDWLRASLDGMSDTGDRVVEIKCGEVAYKYASKYQRSPPHYYGQLQHILLVTGLESVDLWCYLPDRPPIMLSVDRNEDYLRTLLRAEESFWKQVCRERQAE